LFAALFAMEQILRGLWRIIRAIRGLCGWLIGISLIVIVVVALLTVLSYFAEPRLGVFAQDMQVWLMEDKRWQIVLGGMSAVLVIAWNSLSPTLRALFGSGLSKPVVWFLAGLALVESDRLVWIKEDVAYLNKVMGGLVLCVVALGVLAKIRSRRTTPWRESYRPTALYDSQSQIVNNITRLIMDAEPSVFAVSGRWGIGKSFLLKRAREMLGFDESIIWVDFEPWRYASEEALIRGFYDDIARRLAKDIPGIQHIVRPLAETSEKFVKKHDGSGVLGTALDMARTVFSPPVKDAPEVQIEKLLKREGKRLVIVIDDVERSFNAERIFRTLQLAHFAQGIDGVQVVFLFDKDAVLAARPKHFSNQLLGTTEYLEKFVGLEIVVPSPRPAELRQLFSRLVSSRMSSQGFDDFTEKDLSDEMLAAIGTPRATIGLFGELENFQGNMRDGRGEAAAIGPQDLIALAFLKTKYWGLFRDIEVNRDLYTQSRQEDKRASFSFDVDLPKYRKEHFDQLFEMLGYPADDITLLSSLLNDIFPGWVGGRGVSEDDLRINKRVGHRDLLDLYFSYGISHQAFMLRMEHVESVTSIATKPHSEKTIKRAFKDFNTYALSQEETGDIARLLSRQLLRIQREQNVPIMVWRCWLRALVQYESAATAEGANALMAAILSGANDSIRQSFPTVAGDVSPDRVAAAGTLFKNIDRYLADPYLAVLLLMFVHPEQGNDFFVGYMDKHGPKELFGPVLRYVDTYFITEDRNIFRDRGLPYAVFVLKEWSLSVSLTNEINSTAVGAKRRHRRVNDYALQLLKQDTEMIYGFMRQQFWVSDSDGRNSGWRVARTIAQYDNKADLSTLRQLVQTALASQRLEPSQKEELRKLDELLGRHKASR